MAHFHSHDACGGHGHGHIPRDFGRAFFIGIVLNTVFIAAEIIWGLKANSLALLADAGHNAGDVAALALAWGAAVLSRRGPSRHFTYGLRGTSIIASLSNAVMLLVVTGGIAWEALTRLAHPQPAQGATVIVVALVGCAINGATALLFASGRKGDINIRGAYLHMAADAAISLGTALSGAALLATGWLWLDPLVGLCIAVIITAGTWGLMKESAALALQGVPQGIDPARVRAFLQALPGVREVHDLHVWAMSTTDIACSVHLVMPQGHPGDAFIAGLAAQLETDFNIGHTTVQIEIGDSGRECALAPDHVV